jgi:hypothetical protein
MASQASTILLKINDLFDITLHDTGIGNMAVAPTRSTVPSGFRPLFDSHTDNKGLQTTSGQVLKFVSTISVRFK